MTLKAQILQSLQRLFIILVSLTMSLFSEKMFIFNRCISVLMSNLIKKSWTVSIDCVSSSLKVCFLLFLFWLSMSFHSVQAAFKYLRCMYYVHTMIVVCIGTTYLHKSNRWCNNQRWFSLIFLQWNQSPFDV